MGLGMGSKLDDVRPTAPSRPPTVLLVEDDPAVARVTTIWLKALDFDVIVSHDGREALATASRITTPIDLLQTDVLLPGMRGPVLAGAVRRSHPEAAVLFTSGYSPELVAEISAPHTATATLLHNRSRPTAAVHSRGACSTERGLTRHHGRRASGADPSSGRKSPWPPASLHRPRRTTRCSGRRSR
ncbi:MAG: response regulator [Candidatus Limnocylindrales bacterium]